VDCSLQSDDEKVDFPEILGLKEYAYPVNFIRNFLRSEFPFLEVGSRTIKSSCVYVFIEIGPYTKQFLVGGKLVPCSILSTRSKSDIVSLTKLWQWCRRSIRSIRRVGCGLPSLQLPIASRRIDFSYFRIRAKSYLGKSDHV